MKVIVARYKKNRRKIKIISVNIIFFFLFTIGAYLGVDSHMSKMTVKNINTVSQIYKANIQTILEDIRYEVLKLGTDSDIISLNKERIAKRIGFIKYCNNNYKDIIVIDNNNNILSGYINNVKEYMYQEYVREARRGNTSISLPININDKWYFDCVGPINLEDKQIGVIALRISLGDILSNSLNNKSNKDEYEVFIVDNKGYYLSSGRGNMRKIGEDNIDINKLETSIDYAPYSPYKNIDGDYTYGAYYKLNIGDWIMVCEQKQNQSIIYKAMFVVIIMIIFVLGIINKATRLSYEIKSTIDSQGINK